MERLLAHFAPFLNEVAIGATIQILISLLLEESTFFSFDTLFHPIFAKPQMFSIQVMAYAMYATAFHCIFQFLEAFSKMPMVEAGDYQMAALYWCPITEFELVKNHMDDDWEYISPVFATIHHIYMVLVCCFIGLSIIIIRCIYAAGESLLARCLDLNVSDNPFWLNVTSTGLILGDILLAMWTANLFFPARSRNQFNTTESWSVSSEMPRRGPVLTWHFGNPDVPRYGSKVVELIQSSLQSYPARLAHWYNNQHELDEMHHYPALTGTIMFISLCYGFKWIWEDKPQRLRQVEHTIEETLRENAIMHDFEDYLRKRSNRMDGCKAFMASNFKVIRDIIAHNKTLMCQYQFVTAQADALQANLTERAQQLDTYVRDTLVLRRVNTYLHTEVSRLRASADVQIHKACIEALNAQLASANHENINLQQQRDHLQQELEAVRESRASAEARATAAERARRMAVTERSALRTDVERFEQQSAVEREKGADEVIELRLRNAGMAAHVQSLQTRLDMVIRTADETVYALQAEIIALRSNQVSRTRDLESVLAREDQTQTTFRRREDRMRQVRRFKQKQALILKMKLHDETRRADAYKKSNELYEQRLAKLDPILKRRTQTIHDRLKNDEVGQLRRQLEELRPRYGLLQKAVQTYQAEINELKRELAGQQSGSTTRSRADSDEIVRLQDEVVRSRDEIVQLRTEIKHEREDKQRLQIRISDLEAQRGGSRSGDPFIRKQSRGGRGGRGTRRG
ncbi:hypothetical protein TCE0_015f01941 [Talaromyces pinophilus]|uniref:Uncharacterized protein n=1 Tax=Talaromyces pinophilus TaxID=128442 RepID=A0A6V8H157_TALPI|nr:hypothetical protein TCE0_015f01941 [Talaromyces pinophilus]